MNKDAILASVIGFTIGLCITGFLLVGPNILKNLPQISLPKREQKTQQVASANPDNQNDTSVAGGFVVTDPQPDSLLNDKSLTVAGTAEPGSLVIIQGYSEETVVATGGEGKFTASLTLEEGKTDVVVTNYINGKPTALTIPVYYTEEEL